MELEKADRDLQDVLRKTNLDVWTTVDRRWRLIGLLTVATQESIRASRVYRSPELVDSQPQIQRGEPHRVIDTVGWVVGIPSKIILWNRRSENHDIGVETEQAMAEYLAVNHLDTVRFA